MGGAIVAASKVPAERLASMVARLNDMGKAEFPELANAGLCRLYPRAEWGGTDFICADAAQSVWDKAEKFLE